MTWATIRKGAAEKAAAKLSEAVRRDLTWGSARQMLDGLPGGGLNIANASGTAELNGVDFVLNKAGGNGGSGGAPAMKIEPSRA